MGERIAQEHRRACGTRNRRDKTVAATRHVGHIAPTRAPFDEGDENVEGTATEPNRDAPFLQDSLRGGQTKWAKTEHVLRNRPSRLRIHDIHFLSPRYAPRSDLIFNDSGTTSVPSNEAVD